ncbi:hypothetical protein BDW42DRAFT_175095 [Aspergillus taichungensis]|uniref:BTB domain-containing protein n=1 Tax=Aspergillus taichungensis TaxID=482145 RepID=A0A2J5HMG5_9EURO|nr:hypothetical protein BDW42DRAFT_175095 [Aspergillus taichungensis]
MREMEMPDPDSNQIQPADEEPDLEQIDPNGDVILLVAGLESTARFLVSSKILSMASPMLAKLFSPKFSEGAQMASCTSCPTITLHEDDSAAMRTIISILHYQGPPQGDAMTAEDFATLAVHCDKYDCIRALLPWTFKWFNDLQSITTAEDYGYLLLAAHFFRSSADFSRIFKKAQKQLPSNFSTKWDSVEILDLLPYGVHVELTSRIQQLLCKLQEEIHTMEGVLRNKQTFYYMQQLLCTICGRTHPSSARKCHSCDNSDLLKKYCTSELRIAEYFALLERSGLWPSVEPFQRCSADEIVSLISKIKVHLRHSCEAVSCPLQSVLNMLLNCVNRLVGTVTGLDLYPLHGESGMET